MDRFTHGIVGAAWGSAFPEKILGREKRSSIIRACILGAVFPDSDFILSLKSRELYWTEHRGATHSLLLWPFWTLTLVGLFCWFRKRPFSWPLALAFGFG